MASAVTEALTCVATEQCLPNTSPPWRLEEPSRACESNQFVPNDALEREDTALPVEPSTVTEPPMEFRTELADTAPVQCPSLGPATKAVVPGVEISAQPLVNYVQVGGPRQVGWYVSERINISPEEYAQLTGGGAGGEFRSSDAALRNNQAEIMKDTSALVSSDETGVSKVKIKVVRRKSKGCC